MNQSSFNLIKRKIFDPQQTISRLFFARRFSVKDLFGTLTRVMKEFPIHSYNKVILTGNSSAGKTTLTALITERAATNFIWLKSGNVQQVELNTAGICQEYIKLEFYRTHTLCALSTVSTDYCSDIAAYACVIVETHSHSEPVHAHGQILLTCVHVGTVIILWQRCRPPPRPPGPRRVNRKT